MKLGLGPESDRASWDNTLQAGLSGFWVVREVCSLRREGDEGIGS